MTKTISFAVVHFTVAFSVAYILSGSLLVGGAIALVEPVINTLAYHFHEKAWNLREAKAASHNSTNRKLANQPALAG